MREGIPADIRRYLSSRGSSLSGDAAHAHQPVRLRVFFVGTFLSLFLAVGSNYVDVVMRGTYMTLDFSAPGAVFLFLVLVGGLNTLFRFTARWPAAAWIAFGLVGGGLLADSLGASRIEPLAPGFLFVGFLSTALLVNAVLSTRGGNLALNPSELIIVYLMLLVVASLATMGLCETILPAISGVFYYANPENDWLELLVPHLPLEIMVNDGKENALFFEGLPSPEALPPYGIWVRPLLMWGIFLLGLYVTMISLAVILRRQWMDRERLAYPLVQVPQLIIRGEAEGSLVNSFFRSRVMWWGAALPIMAGLLRGLNRYLGGFPVPTLGWSMPVGFDQNLMVRLLFDVIGFSYLISPDIAAGIWSFAVLAKFERIAFIEAGVLKQQPLFGVLSSELINYQGLGAMVVFVGVGLWVGREHLAGVWRAFLGRKDAASDDGEIMSYRGAVAGVLGGSTVMVVWLSVFSVPPWAAVLFVGLAMVIFIGIARIVAEAGVPSVITPMVAPDFMIYGLGSKLLGPAATGTFATTYVYAADVRVFLLGMVANGLKLIEGMDRRSRRLVFWCLLLAIVVGIGGSLWTVMDMAYRGGGINSSTWFFKTMPKKIYAAAAIGTKETGVYWEGLQFFGLGAGGMVLLMWLRQRFLWWPLHPIGFPIMANWIMDQIWFSVFLAWLVKVMILRYGGAGFFTRSRYFFLGLIVGQAGISGLFLVIDYITGVVGNSLFFM